MKILVVDDEVNALHLFLDEVISDTEFEYKFLKDEKEAILSYVKNNDVVGAFLDIKMPNKTNIATKAITIYS